MTQNDTTTTLALCCYEEREMDCDGDAAVRRSANYARTSHDSSRIAQFMTEYVKSNQNLVLTNEKTLHDLITRKKRQYNNFCLLWFSLLVPGLAFLLITGPINKKCAQKRMTAAVHDSSNGSRERKTS